MICARLATRTRRGGVAERLKAHAWKVCMRETVSRVRIPPPPPFTVELVDYYVRNGILPHLLPHPLAKNAADDSEQRRTNIETVSVPALDFPCELRAPREARPKLNAPRASPEAGAAEPAMGQSSNHEAGNHT